MICLAEGSFPSATLGQVTDYGAMAGLADLALDAPFGDMPTVLRLFADAGTERVRQD
jgi:hypothetical protein